MKPFDLVIAGGRVVSADSVIEADIGVMGEAIIAVGAEPAIAAIARGSWHAKDRDAISSSGYVAHTLEAALWCVDQADDYAEAVLLAANLADDCDTVAAVTGQIAGALWGRSSIPARWLDRFAWREVIERKGRQLIATLSTNSTMNTAVD